MKLKFKVTYYRLFGKSWTQICTRSYASTRRNAMRHILKGNAIWFKIEPYTIKKEITTLYDCRGNEVMDGSICTFYIDGKTETGIINKNDKELLLLYGSEKVEEIFLSQEAIKELGLLIIFNDLEEIKLNKNIFLDCNAGKY